MTTRITYTLAVEPRGSVYRSLCDFAAVKALNCLLVIRDQPAPSAKARGVIESLEPYILSKRRSSEWPGTRLFGHDATVYVIGPEPAVWALIRGRAEGLFDWQHPELPEDLCFLRQDGSTFLGTIAHEHDAFVELDAAETNELRMKIPELRLDRSA